MDEDNRSTAEPMEWVKIDPTTGAGEIFCPAEPEITGEDSSVSRYQLWVTIMSLRSAMVQFGVDPKSHTIKNYIKLCQLYTERYEHTA